MPAPPDLRQLVVGDRVQGLLRVVEVEHRESSRGADTALRLGNRHGELPTAPFWAEEQSRIAGIERGAAVQIIAGIGQYNGRRQLQVSSMRTLPGDAVDWRELAPAVGDVAPYWNTLDRWRSRIRGPRLRRTLALFYTDDAPRVIMPNSAACSGTLARWPPLAAPSPGPPAPTPTWSWRALSLSVVGLIGGAVAGGPTAKEGIEKRNGRLVVARRPSHAWTSRGRGITAAVLLPPATGWLIRRSVGRGEASVLIPRPDGHPTWFVHSSAASQIGSRTDRSHCTPRRKIGVDEARDWLHLFAPG